MGPPQSPLASCKPQWHQIAWHSRSLIKYSPPPSTPTQPSLANQQARLPGTLSYFAHHLFRSQQTPVPDSDPSSARPHPKITEAPGVPGQGPIPSFSPLLTQSVLVTQSCETLCNPMDCSPPGTSARGIPQARILEWVAIPISRGSSQPRDRT